MKIGETISKTKLIKMLTGKTQRMWSAEEKCFQDIALTTRYDGNVMTITDFKDTGHYQIIRGESDTQKMKMCYNVKNKMVVTGSILPREVEE
tara:strand:- start:338 stop:613 length:276 start_codon:yes stop_codon:yes gene_type:complete